MSSFNILKIKFYKKEFEYRNTRYIMRYIPSYLQRQLGDVSMSKIAFDNLANTERGVRVGQIVLLALFTNLKPKKSNIKKHPDNQYAYMTLKKLNFLR